MADTRNKVVLVVDDDKPTLSLVSMLLSGAGYRAETVISGPAAISAVSRVVPDLILLDILMPRMDGYATARELRKMLGDELPIVALTGRAERNRRLAVEAGFTGWIEKPFDVSSFLSVVRSHLEGKGPGFPEAEAG